MNNISRFLYLRGVGCSSRRLFIDSKLMSSKRSFSYLRSIEPRDFQILITRNEIKPTSSNVVNSILNGENARYDIEEVQIVDVRESNELESLNFTDDFNRITHLPLSKVDEWAPKIISKDLLDAEKPVVCVCQAGVRSERFAEFLIQQCQFQQVYNLVGGIGLYESEVDPGVRKK